MSVLSFDRVEKLLGAATPAFEKLVGHIRVRYAMDELWDEKDELKFRRGGKTLATVYLREGFFILLIIFGRQEREAFEAAQESFSPFVRNFYENSRTYHDGKWMFIEVRPGADVGELIRLLHIKKKPNRKKEDLSHALLGKCGNRCDACQLFRANSERGGDLLFTEGDYKCYYAPEEDKADYTGYRCDGCRADCAVRACLAARGYESCIECDYENCACTANNFTRPGRCSIGLSSDDVEKFILPYCGRERFDAIQEGRAKG